MVNIGGDTHTARTVIAVPLRIFGQQLIQNAAPTPTMFIIVIDPFCCNQILHLGPIRILHLHNLFAVPPICRQTAPECTKPRIKFQKISGVTPPDHHTLGALALDPGRGKGGKEERGRGRGGREEREGLKGEGEGGRGRGGRKGEEEGIGMV